MAANRSARMLLLVAVGLVFWLAWIPLFLAMAGVAGMFGDPPKTRILDGVIAVVIFAAMLGLRQLIKRLGGRRS